MDMPKPGEAHQKLARLAGRWLGEETMFPSPWDPEGGTAQATTEARVALGGFGVVSDYEQRRGGQVTYSGHGVWMIDTQESGCLLHWFDSLGMGLEVFRGDWDGDVLKVQSRNPMGHARLTYDLSEVDALKVSMETSEDGETWRPMFRGAYTRQS